jgi:hypothetical protein
MALLHQLERKTTASTSKRRLQLLLNTIQKQPTLPRAYWPRITMVSDWANLVSSTFFWEQHDTELPDGWVTATIIADRMTKIGPGTISRTGNLLRISLQHQLALEAGHFFPTTFDTHKLPGLINFLVYTICSHLLDARCKGYRYHHSFPAALTTSRPNSPIVSSFDRAGWAHFAPDSADDEDCSLISISPAAHPMIHAALTPYEEPPCTIPTMLTSVIPGVKSKLFTVTT